MKSPHRFACPSNDSMSVPWGYFLPKWSWAASCLSLWVLSALSTWIVLPRINPDYLTEQTSMEQFGTLTSVIAVVIVAYPLREKLPHSLASSPRRSYLIRVIKLAPVLLVLCLGVFASGVILPPTIVQYYRLLSILLYLGIFFALYSLVGEVAAISVPPLTAIVFTVKGVIPWDLNIIYNPNSSADFSVYIFALLFFSVSVWLVVGDADSRKLLKNS